MTLRRFEPKCVVAVNYVDPFDRFELFFGKNKKKTKFEIYQCFQN
jgi:hypothetical protein